ncbi:MAG TPA: SRPBCC domain-containing protein [Puia sp.]|nr:SRPBCC domain-containing protein [Puia sp.]
MKTKEIEFAQVKNNFSMTCRVETKILAKPEDIWKLLTDAKGFSVWNSTVSAIDGNIREGERIRIHVPGTTRTFKPRVSGVVANKVMVWSNGIAPIFKGTRSFELRPCDNGATEFIMEEEFSGLVFALVKNKLPDFKPIFERYALDLKNEAERSC